MAIITKPVPLLQRGDKVVFCVQGEEIVYEVYDTFLPIRPRNGRFGNNDTIFEKLGLDKYSFCSTHYGYMVSTGDWPVASTISGLTDLTNVVNALYAILGGIVCPGCKETITDYKPSQFSGVYTHPDCCDFKINGTILLKY